MVEYLQEPVTKIRYGDRIISSFITGKERNLDKETVESFGNEWSQFSFFTDKEIKTAGDQYFDVLDFSALTKESVVLDAGCGSGRWSKYISPYVKFVEAIDPSDAVFSALTFTKEDNIRITHAGIDDIPFADNSFDLIICLGVLHHMPDTSKALISLVDKLKDGGQILIYLYYSLDNRGIFYKLIFKISDFFRELISSFNKPVKRIVCDLIACFVYLPLVLLASFTKLVLGGNIYRRLPLSYYVGKSFKIIRNDSLDRFGTPLEQRFSKSEMQDIMVKSGLERITFSPNEPYWHAVGFKPGKHDIS